MICQKSPSIVVSTIRPITYFKKSTTENSAFYPSKLISNFQSKGIDHLATLIDFQDLWRAAAFRYKQQKISSKLPSHLLVSYPWSSLMTPHKKPHDKSGNCAWSSLNNCQEFNSSALNCWSSVYWSKITQASWHKVYA